MRSILLVVFALLALTSSAFADNKFHSVPGRGSELQLRVVEYDGSVNGELTVQVKYASHVPVRFAATGLYFVPDGDPNKAPQRLGAVGPMQIGSDREGAHRSSITIPAGKTVE